MPRRSIERRAILSHFRHAQRQGEEPLCAAWFKRAWVYRRAACRKGAFLKAPATALFCGETLIAGYRIRSDVRSQQFIGELLELRSASAGARRRRTTITSTPAFVRSRPGEAIWFPGAFDDYGRRALAERVSALIPVAAEEAQSFACNAVVVGKHVVTNTGCPQLHRRSCRARLHAPHETPLSEFVKAGGSAKCLTLRLDGEEAAAWKFTS